MVMVFNTTFHHIPVEVVAVSFIGGNHRNAASHWQTLSQFFKI